MVLLSGGIDSAVALAWISRQVEDLFAISFQYYLRPWRERLAVYRLLQSYPAKLIELPFPFLREAHDSRQKISVDVPEGYIPNRNMIFYSTACHFAQMHRCERLVGGHTAEDQGTFPDASRSFFDRLQELMNEALLFGRIEIELPLAKMTKLQVVEKAVEWGVPLQHTWSCYWDGPAPCGQCTSCHERAEAFLRLGHPDPLIPIS